MKKKKENVHDLELKMCISLWFKGKGRIHMSIYLEASSALDKCYCCFYDVSVH